MSELMWKTADGQQYVDFIVSQDLKFQEAMREELHRLAKDRGLRLSSVDIKKQAREREEKVRKALKELSTPQPNWRVICAEVSAKHDIKIADLLSPNRKFKFVRARHEAMWRMRNETSMSLPQIARRLGAGDHTTVISGIEAHERRMAKGTAL